MTKRILVLPGAARSDDLEYRPVYEMVRKGAAEKFPGCEYVYQQVVYPGQQDMSGEFHYSSALEHVRAVCTAFQPTWIVGFSFGGYLAIGLLASPEVQAAAWFQELDGCVLWGSSTRQNLDRFIPTTARAKAVENLGARQPPTAVADDFFDTFPETERLIESVPCHLRFAYGSEDGSIDPDEVNLLVAKHKQYALLSHHYSTELVVIDGLEHNVGKIKGGKPTHVPPDSLCRYIDCLFDPIASDNR
jgi:hypothetical protein